MLKRKKTISRFVNVKLPEIFVEIIDQNLDKKKVLGGMGFDRRAHFVQIAVLEKLQKLNLVSQTEAKEFVERKKKK